MAAVIFLWALWGAAVILAGVSATVAVSASVDALAESSRARKAVARTARAAEEEMESLVLSEVGAVRRGSRWDKLLNSRFGQHLEQSVVAAGIDMPTDVLVGRTTMVAVTAFVLGSLILGNMIPGIVLAAASVAIPYAWLTSQAEARVEKMRTQLPDALTLLGNSLASGLSLVQALEYAAKETPNPLGGQLWRVVHDVGAGRSLSEALDRFRQAIPLRELQTVATAIEVQRRVGGNLREMLAQATSAVRESLELRMTLRAQTAQGRMSSRLVGFLPLILTGVIALFDPTYVAPFFDRPMGLLLLSVALIAEVLGFLAIRRIVDVEV